MVVKCTECKKLSCFSDLLAKVSDGNIEFDLPEIALCQERPVEILCPTSVKVTIRFHCKACTHLIARVDASHTFDLEMKE
jgi:hypothetical protein